MLTQGYVFFFYNVYIFINVIIIFWYPKDLFAMRTPGGGGYGKPGDEEISGDGLTKRNFTFPERGSVHDYRQAQESA